MPKFGLSILVKGTSERIDSLITVDQTLLASNLRDELRWLLDCLTRILDLLLDADKRSIEPSFYSYYLFNLREVIYKAEDVIDELAHEILCPNKVTSQLTFLQKLIFNLKFVHKINTLNHSFRKIEDGIEALRSDWFVPISLSDLDRVRDLVLDNPIIGREADASKIVNLLTQSSDQRVLTVVPIVGMDGIGKTSLAKFVCQRLMALDLFDVKFWVCVSDKCDEVEVLGQMLRSSNATIAGSVSLTDKDAIFKHLEKELAGKSFILVLDDVCEDVSSWWGDFRTGLLKMCTNNGNVVLVTTLSAKVASVVETSSQHRHTLDFLSDDDCWLVFKEMAFRNVRVQSNLEAIGRDIAKRCRGVPLASKVLGGTLGFIRDEGASLKTRDGHFVKASDTNRIEGARSEIRDTPWELERGNEENVKSVLELCFFYLPPSLKECFAFCSVFPKGFLIKQDDMIRMWMAERLADSFDMGNDYFHSLLVNSFFQDAESDDDGNVIKCKMHNLVHDLAFSSLEKPKRSIHSLYVDYQSINALEALPKNKAKYLTTIILNGGAAFQSSWKSKRLRTLCLNDVDIENLPSSISKLKYFRHLHVSNTKTRLLPTSITEIYMLQSLTLSNCSCEHLPFLGYLPCLKLLKISHMERVKCINSELYGIENESNNNEQHELTLFPTLKSLSLSWMENLTECSPPYHGNKVFVFPRLENLSIQSCANLTGFPMRDLSTLVKIEIRDCEELRFIFDQHKSFPSITSLSIVGCPKLTCVQNWLIFNKSLKEFRVRRCEWLYFIPKDLGMQKSLVSLQICCCKELRFFSEVILCKLTQLRKLIIGAFSKELDDFSYLNRIKDITTLEELEIWGSDVFGRKMSALPDQLQHLPKLKSLKIKGFTTMETLLEWLPNLQYLETISLNYCWDLKYQSTAATIQRLPYLSQVCVSGCCALEKHKSQWMEFSSKSKTRICFQ